MRKVETAHARAGMHRKRFGQRDPVVLLRVEQIEERALFRVIGDAGYPAGGTNPAIFFADEIFLREFFVAPKSPRDPCLLVEIFRERFRQSVRQAPWSGSRCNHHDRRKTPSPVRPRRCLRHRETAEVIRSASLSAVRRRDEIRQAMIELSGRLLHLLPQKMKCREFLCARFVRVNLDIVADAFAGQNP